MADNPKDIYGSREPGRAAVQERVHDAASERWFASITRNTVSTVVLVVLLLGFLGVLTGIILYQQRELRRSRTAGEADATPVSLAPAPRVGMDVYMDPSGHLILDEIEPAVSEEDALAGPSALTPKWVMQAAFNLRQAQRAYSEQNWQAALTEYAAAIKILPQLTGVHEIMGLCHLRLREFGEAEKIFSGAASTRTNSPALLNNLGVALLGQNKYDDAEKQFRAAIELQPQYLSARQNLALLYFRANRMAQATEAFDAVLRLDPQNVEASLMYAASLTKVERWADAAVVLGETAKQNPQIAPVHFRLAVAKAHAGDMPGAQKALQAGLDLVDLRTAMLWLNRREMNIMRDQPEFQSKVAEITQALK